MCLSGVGGNSEECEETETSNAERVGEVDPIYVYAGDITRDSKWNPCL